MPALIRPAPMDLLRGALAAEAAMREVVGKSRALGDVISLVSRVADSPAVAKSALS